MAPKKWAVGDKVLDQYKGDIYYAAKIIEVTEKKGETCYKIHYDGWGPRHDKYVTEKQTETKWKPWNEQTAAEAKEAIKAAKGGNQKRKSTSSSASTPVEKKRGEVSSRASTPVSVKAVEKAKPKKEFVPPPIATATQKEPVLQKDMSITLPNHIKQIIVDDYQNTFAHKKILVIPPKATVAQIIESYIESLSLVVPSKEDGSGNEAQGSKAEMILCAQGLERLFNLFVGTRLLVNFERKQFDDLSQQAKAKVKRSKKSDGGEEAEQFKASKFYGLTHFLRLFVHFGNIMKSVPWDDNIFDAIERFAQNLVDYLGQNVDKFYDPSSAYMKADDAYIAAVEATK